MSQPAISSVPPEQREQFFSLLRQRRTHRQVAQERAELEAMRQRLVGLIAAAPSDGVRRQTHKALQELTTLIDAVAKS